MCVIVCVCVTVCMSGCAFWHFLLTWSITKKDFEFDQNKKSCCIRSKQRWNLSCYPLCKMTTKMPLVEKNFSFFQQIKCWAVKSVKGRESSQFSLWQGTRLGVWEIKLIEYKPHYNFFVTVTKAVFTHPVFSCVFEDQVSISSIFYAQIFCMNFSPKPKHN